MNRVPEFLAGRADLALIGMRGSGKSTVGRSLAAALGREFIDTDVTIAEQVGLPITQIFETRGEAGFRAFEADIVRDLLRGAGRVIALGGGAILNADTRAYVREHAVCVWLNASATTLRQRLSADVRTPASRPALTGAGVLDEITTVLTQREPLYQAAADVVIDTTSLNPDACVAAIRVALEPQGDALRPPA